MTINFLAVAAAALVPFILGFIWFHDKLFGGHTWKEVAQLNDDHKVSRIKLLSTLILNFFIAFSLTLICNHQISVGAMLGGNPELLTQGTAAAFMAEYGHYHQNFAHGMLHGFAPASIFFAGPILGYITIFEDKSLHYFLINFGYWAISLSLMGGIIGQWGFEPLVLS